MDSSSNKAEVEDRLKAILHVGKYLATIRNELAILPGTMCDAKVRYVSAIALRTLTRLKVNQVPKHERSEMILPLVKIHDLGKQVLWLWELQTKLNQDIRTFSNRINILQASLPADSDDIRTVMSDAHDFMIFATFANELQIEEELTEETVWYAKIRNGSGLSGFLEGTQTVENLRAAYSIQIELENSKDKAKPTVSNPISLSTTTLIIISEWYRYQDIHMDPIKKAKRVRCLWPLITFNKLVTWFTNSRRRILSDTFNMRPAFKIMVDKAVISKEQLAKMRKEQSMDKEQLSGIRKERSTDNERAGNQPVNETMKTLISEVAEIAELVPFQYFDYPAFPTRKMISPLYTTYWVSDHMDASTQEIQRLIKAIYMSYATATRISTNTVLSIHWPDMDTQYCDTLDASTELEVEYLQMIGVFFDALRLKEAGSYVQPRPLEFTQTTKAQVDAPKPLERQAKSATQGIKSGKKRFADTTDDDKVSQAAKLPGPKKEKELEGDTFPARLCEAVFNALGELNNAEERYLASATNFSIDEIRFRYKCNLVPRP